MIALDDRLTLVQHIDTAHATDARLRLACEVAGIDLRTLQRWKSSSGLVEGDGRPRSAHPTPRHALTDTERAHLLSVANEPRFADVPPARIAGMPRHRERYAHRPRISPPPRVRCGVGT